MVASRVSVCTGEAIDGVTAVVAVGVAVEAVKGVTGVGESAGEQAVMIKISHGTSKTFFMSIFSPDRERN